ncbi:uncharacterized protein F5891DRAFT_1035307 [Suillus fuscotomentosus]|uniref:C2H2-type domain-containing protein n=1 Tax=Suillus fuscotomentosus TaxID=1912939 RepID=A0AAD4E7N1_9AGAM|nr:uncharacterized protein F5891DRAFT_1035307 [Suillus fuscotomentosus]KAG1899944.1 hypothetical protein F5891DRAFT_1035307 [Suillus fuscotomentosus]
MRKRWQCNLCNRPFRSTRALFTHCRDKADHPFCEDCQTLFYNFAGLYQHWNEVDEYAFGSDDDEDDVDGEEPPFCVGCNRWFVDLANLYQHLATSLKHNWCFLCSRDFATPTSLDQHSSPVHNGLDFECPLCSKIFKIPSLIALHIQSGACHNISRAQVTAAVHALNIVPSISVSRHIEGGSTRVASYYVTERAFNGTAYESLNSHINSPAHDADEFKCPKCERKYKFVSGLMQHIESEACGVARFEVVEDFTMSLIDQLL